MPENISPIRGLYTIVDTLDRTDVSPVDLARLYLEGGARLLQLRQKSAASREREAIAREILSFKKKYSFTFIINDDPELAVRIHADGVHLGQEDKSVTEARKILGDEALIGKSTHSWEEAAHAMREPVDYIACGAIFPTGSKPADHPVVGTRLLEKIVSVSPVPVVAIGGISRSNVEETLKVGVASFALISALVKAPDILQETAYFIGILRDPDNAKPPKV